MEGAWFSKNISTALIMLLNLSSALLVLGAVFMVEIFSVLLGIGSGAYLQANYSKVQLQTNLQQLYATGISLHDGVLEAYVLAIIGMILLCVAFLLFIRRHEKTVGGAKRYATMHTAFVFMYALVFYIISIDTGSYLSGSYLLIIYGAMAVAVLVDLFFDYALRVQRDHTARIHRSLSVDPSTPFSNMVELQDKIFSKLHGDIKIVDKHFNSTALSNFHRLMSGSFTNSRSITVVGSAEMMDSNFGRNVADFRKELASHGVRFEVRLMDDGDSVEQHERLMLDDKVAYKIPPFNIINRRSEHLIMIGRGEAERRFNYLYGRATSLENYSVRKGREDTDGQATG